MSVRRDVLRMSDADPEWHLRAAEYLDIASRAFGDECDVARAQDA